MIQSSNYTTVTLTKTPKIWQLIQFEHFSPVEMFIVLDFKPEQNFRHPRALEIDP